MYLYVSSQVTLMMEEATITMSKVSFLLKQILLLDTEL